MNQLIKRKLVIEEPEKLFFTADQHFCHHSIIRLSQRPFTDLEHMHQTIIRHWQDAVKDTDDIVILGDIFWKENFRDEYETILAHLPGKKHLVFGNHDYFTKEQYLEMGFASAQSYLEVLIGNTRIACLHYPMCEWNGYYRGSLHFYGHVHGNFNHPSSRTLDVGVDAHNFAPVKWLDIAGKYKK